MLMLPQPMLDPAPIFETFRGNQAMELLTAAVAHFDLFGKLAAGPVELSRLQAELGLADRPLRVLLTGLAAVGLVAESGGLARLTPLAEEHLVPGGLLDVGDYIRMGADAPGVLTLVARMRANRPAGIAAGDDRPAFLFKEGEASSMDEAATSRHLTLMLAGRAKNIAPVLAQRVDLSSARQLLDVGGGTGVYTIAFLQRYPRLRGVIFDRPPVLEVAAEFAQRHGVADRMEFVPGDMFRDPLPADCDAILLSNVLHDWDIPDCQRLVGRCAAALPAGGRLLVHDCFLNDDLSGPWYPAMFSVALFLLTEGRNYSGAEYKTMLTSAGLLPGEVLPTLVHSSVVVGTKR
ncbi:MAG: methyltransferase [Pirellulaceae bacterium]|nr:methyltransferase [Pirellulaceae bacterium]